MDPAATIAHVAPRVAEAASSSDLVLLTEAFSTGFGDFREAAQTFDGPAVSFLRDSASESSGAWVGASVILRNRHDQSQLHNTFVLAGPRGELYMYDKVHASFFDGERDQVQGGQRLVTCRVAGLRLSLTTCYDLRFANLYWRLAPQTDAYLIVANWPAARQSHWQTLIRARAIENQAYVVASNRVGVDGRGTKFAGGSCVVDPRGVPITTADSSEQLISASLIANVVASAREELPVLAHRTDIERLPMGS